MKYQFLVGIDHPILLRKFMPVQILLNENRRFPKQGQAETDFIKTRLLPAIFSAISHSSQSEFNKFIELLMKFVLYDWEKGKCLKSIKLVGLIFGYISSIAPKDVVKEFLVLFSKHESPSQVKYFILPEVVKYFNHPLKQILPDKILYNLVHFIQVNQKSLNSAALDEKFYRPFCKDLQYVWSDAEATNLTPVFVQMIGIIPKMGDETITEVFKIIKVQLDQPKVPIYTLLSLSIILTGFQSVPLPVSEWKWQEISGFCSAILKEVCRKEPLPPGTPKEIRYFIIDLLCYFLNEVVKFESGDRVKEIIHAVQPQPQPESVAEVVRNAASEAQNTPTPPLSLNSMPTQEIFNEKRPTANRIILDLENLHERFLKVEHVPKFNAEEKQRYEQVVNELNSQFGRICPMETD